MKLTWRSVLIAGMGVFTDGYNLYSLSLVIYSISNFIRLNNVTSGLLVAGSYFGAAISALIFGLISDFQGRKRMYGIDVTLMTIGAFLQAFSQNYGELFFSRLLLGMGIGADYVLSPVIVAENADKDKRGKAMVITFAVMWGLGAVVAAFVTQISYFLPASLGWRMVLGLGAIPALSVILARRKLSETLLFLSKVKPDIKELNKLKSDGVDLKVNVDESSFLIRLIKSMRFIIIAAILWVLYDIYSSTFAIYGPITIAHNLGLSPIMFTYVAQFFAGIPGQLICIFLVDRIGRRKLIVLGYAGVALWLVMYSLLLINPFIFGLPKTSTLEGTGAVLGFSFYMLNYLFSAMGPASIIGSGMIAPELSFTKVRATSQAISVACLLYTSPSPRLDRSSAASDVYKRQASATVISLFPSLVNIVGLGVMVGIYASVALISSLIVMFFVPETRTRELDFITEGGRSKIN
ncbi:MFS transporter [Sulfolobus acidocaldarius]|uniref:MFS transporter n=1 Tax=Sulfolobus acidocaldarius TaxID=2285 RepID=UPI000783CA8F|nr:MFS transporter [Sulfolobus acidocaldarius]